MTTEEKKEIDRQLQHALQTATGGNDPDDPGNLKAAFIQLVCTVGDLIDLLYNEGDGR